MELTKIIIIAAKIANMTGGTKVQMLDKKQARKDLKLLYDPHSLCYNDQYYVNSLIQKYGMSLTELEKLIGRPRIVSEWKWD